MHAYTEKYEYKQVAVASFQRYTLSFFITLPAIIVGGHFVPTLKSAHKFTTCYFLKSTGLYTIFLYMYVYR